ncbi:uncharacterized protein [Heptranchias perlo]|uniref:uncharacterized protein n=1 Tax=Heptranchias perlo TaxID=212740 RepID=UPI00355A3B1D
MTDAHGIQAPVSPFSKEERRREKERINKKPMDVPKEPAAPVPAQPSPAWPNPAEPSPPQPSPHQPSPAQSSPPQPSPAQPSPAQSSPAQPSPIQPTPAQPNPAHPSPAQSSPPQPSPAQSSPAQPNPIQPTPAQPGPIQPSPAHTSPAQPNPAHPSPAQPSPIQPSPAQPTLIQPSPAWPGPAQPSPIQPSPARPSPAQPSPIQPRPTQPSPSQSPAKPNPAQPRSVQPSPAQVSTLQQMLLLTPPVANIMIDTSASRDLAGEDQEAALAKTYSTREQGQVEITEEKQELVSWRFCSSHVVEIAFRVVDKKEKQRWRNRRFQRHRTLVAKMAHSPKGGVMIRHQIIDGKHQYKIQEVLHCKGSRSVFRRGDHLLQVNNKNVLDFPPEALAELLKENSTLLTLHSPEYKTESSDPEEPSEDVYWPYDKRKIQLQFSLEMVGEDDGCESLETQAAPESNDTTLPDEIRRKDGDCELPETAPVPQDSHITTNAAEEKRGATCGSNKACGLLVAVNDVTVSVMRGRGPHFSSGRGCAVCKKKNCDVHTVTVSSEDKSEVYYLEEGMSPSDCCGMIMKVMNSDCPFLIHNERDQYLRPGNGHKRIVLSRQNSESAQVTIFYYKSNKILRPYRGMPVVLNFSKTSCFLMCHSEGNNVLLRIEECTSQSLKKITENSPKWRFIFYMKERQDGTLSFESAQYRGWFINNQWKKRIAEMKRTVEETLDADFIFILVKI